MFTFTLCTFDASRLHQTHVCSDGKNALELVRESLLHGQHASDVVAEVILPHLHLHLEGIEVVDPVD